MHFYERYASSFVFFLLFTFLTRFLSSKYDLISYCIFFFISFTLIWLINWTFLLVYFCILSFSYLILKIQLVDVVVCFLYDFGFYLFFKLNVGCTLINFYRRKRLFFFNWCFYYSILNNLAADLALRKFYVKSILIPFYFK